MNLLLFTSNNRYLMAALDHRGSLKKYLADDNQIIDFKRKLIVAIGEKTSGLLLDVNFGLPAFKSTTVKKPYLLAIEKSGYQESNNDRYNELEFEVSQLKQLGASGVKLLLYFHPQSTTKDHQLIIAHQVLDQCQKENLPLFLEIVTYQKNQEEKKSALILESLKIFLEKGIRPAVFKLEFPGSLESAKQVTNLVSPTPWILLTQGDQYPVFVEKLKQAIIGGAVGFLAGRSLWQDYFTTDDKEKFLKERLIPRFKEISSIAFSSQ
jgi:tagatose-1,6-bisphosphate aldolase